MSQELRDLQALAFAARAAMISETVAHTNTRVELTTTQAALHATQVALTNAMVVHGQEVTAHSATTVQLERFQALHTTDVNYIIELHTEIRDLKRTLAATQAALVVSEEARQDAEAFAMQF
jgi:predicted nicotinamide N-methyase